ncbi:hypothetical protein FA048_13650 [Pedobacter polaris]|uniref:Uncharacterized protein n=1 Tax=Pedobacter polaris TaxID=2571273 RepID=A0A4U1CLN5_9SPHI|nr:polysaccharide biosynthesis/export family protein [Pedobacter polaris]TKC08197.1 hypothetical protein FA048_13650 [Pedobacter polaris]
MIKKLLSINNLFFLVIIIFMLCSCSARKEQALFNAPTDIVTDTIKQVYVVNDQGMGDIYYKIKVNDLLAIRNLQDKEFGVKGGISVAPVAVSGPNVTSYQVDKDGNVDLPAIGKVYVQGLTRKQASLKLQEIYGNKLLKDPIIEVSVVNVKVTLFGEFNKQGNFLLERDNTTLIDILGEAGGLTKNADRKTLKIIRGEKDKQEIIYVNLNDINSLASRYSKLVLQNNDIIIINQTKSNALSEKLQSVNSVIQPVLVLLNVALLIFTFTK